MSECVLLWSKLLILLKASRGRLKLWCRKSFEHIVQETLDDEITRLEHGIDRTAAHDSLQTKSAVSKEICGFKKP